MTRFHYKAVSAAGELIDEEAEAPNRQAIVDKLHGLGHIPIRIEESGTRRTSAKLSAGPLVLTRPLGLRELVLLTRELATLLEAGLPLDRALTVLMNSTRNRAVQRLVADVQERVRGGASLADGLAAHPELFPNYYVGMVRAGEAGGSLVAVLGQLAETLERNQAVRQNVRSALQYPMIVLVVAGLSLLVIMTAVVPEFRPLFEGAGAALPLSTQIVVGASELFVDYWWLPALLILGAILLVRQHNRSPEGRLRWDALMLRLPLFGRITTNVEVSRLSRTLGTLLQNGVSALEAFAMTSETVSNRAIAQALTEVRGKLRKGEGLAEPLMRTGVLPPLAVQLIEVGEESGQLEAMLLRVADIYDAEVKRTIERSLSLLVPLVTIGLGVLVAGIIGSIFSAIMQSYEFAF